MISCGIDPGIHGGISFVGRNKGLEASLDPFFCESYPMPIMKIGTKTRLDAPAIIALLNEHPDIGRVTIEKVGAMPGQGVTSMFSFGYSSGLLEGIVAACGIAYQLVTPQTWMKSVLLGLPKEEGSKGSIVWCQRMFPKLDWRGTERSKKLHDGKTDSACLAYFGLMYNV